MNTSASSIPLPHKAKVIKTMWRPMMDALAGGSADGNITADDLMEFFSFGMAMIIDNDSNLNNPRATRLAVETAKTHVARNVRTLSTVRESSGGRSFLTMVMEDQDDGVAGANDNLFGSVSND